MTDSAAPTAADHHPEGLSWEMRPLPGSCRCNEALPLDDAERLAMREQVETKFREILHILRIDTQNDHNTRDTPKRFAKMMVEELMRGRFTPEPELTDFENIDGTSGLILSGPLDIRSLCAHHMMPIYGHAFVGIVPSPKGRIMGLSKFDRIVDYFSARPQIQEELVNQIGHFIVDKTQPLGLAVRINAVHMCKTHRGVRSGHLGRMVTHFYHGILEQDHRLQDQFLADCRAIEAQPGARA